MASEGFIFSIPSLSLDKNEVKAIFIYKHKRNMKEEIRWKPVPNYDGYEVSELGQVRSVKRNKILKAHPNKNYKYLQVALWKNSKMKLLYLHRVVAETFIDNPNGYKIVRHIDGDVTNNTVTNLIWAETPNYRNQYSK